MSLVTLTNLNSIAATAVEFEADTVIIDYTTGNTFRHQPVTWDATRSLGPLANRAVQLVYELQTANVSISFPESAEGTNPLTINTVGNVTTVGNIGTVLDYNAARAEFDPGAVTGNILYQVSYLNTEQLAGNIIVAYVAQEI